MVRRVAVVALAALSACIVRLGPDPKKKEVVRAQGTTATLRTASQGVVGELLEVNDTAFLVAATSGLTLVKRQAVVRMTFEDLQEFPPRGLTPYEMDQVRHWSRFPQGMPSEVLRKLLAQRQQSELYVMDR
jgi:hypothetical protein